ncbi:SpoIIE family protein phosphatase [Streptomyces sp. SID14478]|uniref:SpoIIE family protein phosphatase n=1 Tax=Streptomyces sp. SID14478 TaxID=2706073 RepID=UPI0013D9C67F|nr:SpoIIE family protein phosphatase [Streptomyces sp. SID14478]NEB76044.1 SpoIIE family protein phosphatase [Streptomyces sp. SID14478]
MGSDEMEREPSVHTETDAFTADREVGRDLAAVDWAATALGPPGNWPQSLRTAVNILLSSRFSMWMAWGPELTFFCNAAYRRDTLGGKYPWALGRSAREVWAEIWDDIGPRIDTVLTTGQATWDEALLLFLERSGFPEETYHTFSYSPLRDDTGAVVGMLCVVSEDTDRVIGERRMATLRDIGSDPSVVRTEQEMLAFTDRQLSRNLKDLPFTLTYLFDGEGGARLAGTSGIGEGHPAAPAVVTADAPRAPWPLAALARGEQIRVDLEAVEALPAGEWADPPREALVVPLLQQGSAPYGFLVAGMNRYRPLDDGYRGFLELTAGHIAAGISSARSYETQQRRAEALAELDRAKTAFFSNISHEFRTPLTLIMGPLDELRGRTGDSDPGMREELDVVHRNALRLAKLVNTLLDFSRLEAGRMQAVYEPVDLATVTAQLASVFRSAMDRAGLTFDVDCEPLTEPVHLDRDMWEKVVLNLLSNALKFTFDGSVRVAVHGEGTHAVVTVEDSGVGVPAAEMPRLFERFHRIANTRARSNEGSGIGLALVQELVSLHSGTITAQSAEGEGTCFTIRLPFGSGHLPAGTIAPPGDARTKVASADPYLQEALRWLPTEHLDAGAGLAPEPADSLTPALGALAPASARVLIADDNADMREYLSRLMAGAGYRVEAVGDGRAALDAVRTHAPDLVISDVMMPRLDGLALVRVLREDSRTASVPVLLLSARAGQEASIEGLRAGADDYLVKPFAAAELLARARANIELARLRGHHARWRTALVDSLQEAFFVCDEDGQVIEINAAFSDLLGYGPEGLPYPPAHPWWAPAADPDDAGPLTWMSGAANGSRTVPVIHRDGHRLWATVTFAQAQDPDTERRVVVGTLRDVSAEHYAIQRESALASLSTRLSRATNLADALAGALAELQVLWQARTVVAAVFDRPDEPTLTASAPLTWQELPQARRRAIEALRARPLLTPVPGDAGAGVVLEHPEGAMVVWIDLGDRAFTEEDQLLLSLLAGHLAQGLTRAHQIDQQRETAVALQRAILGPSRLPEGFAVRYEPATRPLEVGGDWYDTLTLTDGRIGIVVGDCVGHGLEAATVMGQLRSACRALLLQDAGPASVLQALDHFAADLPGAECTTVFCGVLDPETGRLVYSTAGHPPGILTDPDGTSRLLDEARSLPLAVRPGRTRPQAECILPARATLLLYTDGLVERRGRSLTQGIVAAGEVVRNGRHLTVEEIASDVLGRLAPPDGYDDDVALLLYRHPSPLALTFPAESSQLAPVRHALRTWLYRCEIPVTTSQNILIAAGEACANAIEHGHRDAPGDVIQLRAELFLDDLRLTVADSGRWRTPVPEASAHRGRGITLMRALMQHVTISPGTTGTVVDMRARISS